MRATRSRWVLLAALLLWCACGRLGYDAVYTAAGGASGTDGGAGAAGIASTGGASGGEAGGGGAAGGAGAAGHGGGGAGGVAGGGGMAGGSSSGPCLQALTDQASFTAAAAGHTSDTEDFSVDAAGNAVTSYGYYAGNDFAHQADVTFGSFQASTQVAPGTTASTVFSLGGPGVKSSLGFAPGFDGITSTFSSSEMAVWISARSDGPDSFTLSVNSSNSSTRTTFTFYASGGALVAGVRSVCGDIIQLVDFSPDYSATGDGNSQYWELASISYAR